MADCLANVNELACSINPNLRVYQYNSMYTLAFKMNPQGGVENIFSANRLALIRNYLYSIETLRRLGVVK